MTLSDPALALFWIFLVMAGLSSAVLLRKRGVASARVRDVLHVGAGVWVFGWPAWDRPHAPLAIVWGAVAVLAVMPLLAARRAPASRLVGAVTTDDEGWTGLVAYALSFALLTTLALATTLGDTPAAGGLLALAWGDGLGGVVGSRVGGPGYHLPWAKRKTWVGTAVVAVATVVGLLAWVAWSGSEVPWSAVAGAAVLAALSEAAAPRGTDNLVVPVTVFAWLAWAIPAASAGSAP